MKTLHSICAIVALGLAGTALAQSESSQYPQGSRPDPATTAPPPSGTTEPGPATDPGSAGASDTAAGSDTAGSMRTAGAADTTMSGERRRGTNIIGMNVQTQAGESLGTVKDIVLDDQGKLTHVIVSHGGTLGFGNKLTAVPWDHARSMMSGRNLVLQKERLQSAPSFEEGRWPDLASASWSMSADRYWQQQGGTAPTRAAEAPPADGGSTTSPPPTESKDRG